MVTLSEEQSKNMHSGYRKLFWGILLLVFHINLGPVPIFPDFIGYIILALGVGDLRSGMDRGSLKRAGIITGIMIVESIVELVIPMEEMFQNYLLLTALMTGISAILLLILFYDILTASAAMLREIEDSVLAAQTEQFLRTFLVMDTLLSIAVMVTVLCPEAIVIWIVGGSRLLLYLWLASVFSNLRKRHFALASGK